MVNDAVLSVDEMLARSAAAAAAKAAGKQAGQSKIQQMLAGVEESDTVDLSPVAKLLLAQDAEGKKTSTPYTEQDWYLQAKVSQLRGQIEIYANLPGLDPSGAVMRSLTDEVTALVSKQQAKLKKSNDEAAAKQAELDKLNAEKLLADSIPSAEQLIKRANARLNGETVEEFAPQTDADKAKDAAVKALLDAAKKKVDTTA